MHVVEVFYQGYQTIMSICFEDDVYEYCKQTTDTSFTKMLEFKVPNVNQLEILKCIVSVHCNRTHENNWKKIKNHECLLDLEALYKNAKSTEFNSEVVSLAADLLDKVSEETIAKCYPKLSDVFIAILQTAKSYVAPVKEKVEKTTEAEK